MNKEELSKIINKNFNDYCENRDCDDCEYYKNKKVPCEILFTVSYTLDNYMLEERPKPKPKPKKFSEDEKTIVRNLPKNIEWITRDEDGELWGYGRKPENLGYSIWCNGGDSENLALFNHLFRDITWEDTEPTSVEEILGEVRDDE